MKIKSFLGVLILSTIALSQSSVYAQAQRDWAGFHVYAADNARLDSLNAKVQVVFYGNSITQIWNEIRPHFGYQIMEPIILKAIGRYHNPTKILKEIL